MLQDIGLKLLRGLGELLMIPVRGVAVLIARLLYPMSIVGFFGSIAMAIALASRKDWSGFAMAPVTMLASAGLFLAARAVLRRWYTPSTRPRVRYVYRESIY